MAAPFRVPPSRIQGNYLGAPPQSVRVTPFTGPRDTLAAMERVTLGPRGEQSMVVRQFTEYVTRGIAPKDYLGEILAIRNVFVMPSPWKPDRPLFRYMNDPRHVEWIKDPQRMVEEIHQHGSTTIDCFVEGTLVLARGHRFVPIEAVVPGMEIWGHDGWTRVKALAYKGVREVSAVRMNNGSTVMATDEHPFMVEFCRKHPDDWTLSRPCPCDDRERKKVALRDLQPKMVLMTPDRIAFGDDEQCPDRAFLEGLYIADGWKCGGSGFAISGREGKPKEAQKREVEAICERLGYKTTWRDKSIYVGAGKEWMERISAMGSVAPQKRALSINLGEAAAANLLRGIMADSGRNSGSATLKTRTFTTTSHALMLQTRLLHKMFGVTCGYSYIENHGGLGKNPIWRLSTRQHPRKLRVKEVLRSVGEAPVYDIETESGYVYLPEHDVTVHNCDEYAVLGATMCLQLGRECELVAVGFAPGSLTHVGFRVKEPKSGQWIWVDPVAGPREREAAATAKEVLRWSLD